MISQEQVFDALKNVRFPGLSRDIVSFGFVKEVRIDGGNVDLLIQFSTENPQIGAQIKAESEEAVSKIDGVTAVNIDMQLAAKPQAAPEPPVVKSLDGVKYIIAVASGKGGVGKSTVSTNLAIALAANGNKVGLLDADIYGPSQQMMLGIDGRPQIDEEDEKIIPMERHGVKTMSLGLITEPDTPVIWRGPMVMKALEQFLMDVRWGELDYMIIDLPPGTGDAQLTLTQRVPLTGAVIVTTPQDVALIDARKGLAMFRKVNVPVFGLIENMSFFTCRHCGEREEIFGHGGGRKTAEQLGIPFLGEIPIDPKVVVGGDSGEPIVTLDPESAAAKAFKTLASHIEHVKKDDGGSVAGHDHDHQHHHDHDHDHAH